MQTNTNVGVNETVMSKFSIVDELFSCDYGSGVLTYDKIGELIVKSGSIVACDPLCLSNIEPFIIPVPNGSFPVFLSDIDFIWGYHIVAEAVLNFSNEDVVEWKSALVKKQDPFYSGKEISEYTVDSGIGCFMDAEVAKLLLSKMKDENYADKITDEIEKSFSETMSLANIEINSETGGNLIAFSTGFGDGIYSSQIGYDKNGKIACIVTDFDIL